MARSNIGDGFYIKEFFMSEETKDGIHRWSGWPGAWCLDCGCECPAELELADIVVPEDHPGRLPCKFKGRGLYDPYRAM